MGFTPIPDAKNIKLIECPRDAMQGYETIFSTAAKINYLNNLLKVGFDILDCASFVSPKAIPQMADSKEVLAEIDTNPNTQLLAIIANTRGATEAAQQEKIDILGYPFSISETFQKRNTNKSIAESKTILTEIMEVCKGQNKALVVYLSMGFGNPYGEIWNPEIVSQRVAELIDIGVNTISLSDTVGSANKADIFTIFNHLIPQYPAVEFGAHLHCKPYEWKEKLDAAYQAGCTRFDGAIRGFGGCPMATNDLTGNMQTESIVSLFKEKLSPKFNFKAFDKSLRNADQLFAHK